MKKAFQLTLLFLALIFSNIIAQEEHPFINPGKIIEEAFTLRDSARYDDAIKLLLQIDRSDTSYIYALTELASTYLSAKKYPEAVDATNKALQSKSIYQLRLYLIKGNAFDQNGMGDSSIAVYKTVLKKYPYSYLVYYNMGVTYLNQKKYDQSIESLQQALRLNPFHASSHLMLGKISALMGYYTHAMLSLEMFLTLEPNTGRSNPNLVFLNNLVNNALGSEYEKIPPTGKNAFEELDQLLKSAIAMNKGYKLKLDFDAPVSRQSQLLFESLEYKEKTGDYWMDTYVPIYMDVKQNNYVEPFIYRILTSAPDKVIPNQLKKLQKSVELMKQLLGNDITKLHNNYKIIRDGKEYVLDIFLNNDNYLISMGKYKEDGKTRYGHWIFYHINGEIKEEGNYTDDGKLQGKWVNYNTDGTISYVENYNQGELDGDLTGYYSDEKKRYEAKYAKGEPLGDVQYFFDCDAVSSVITFKGGSRNGKGKNFYKNGALKEEFFYKNDSLENESIGYFPNGSKQWNYNYESNKFQGKQTDYYINGKVQKESTYLLGELNGPYKEFFKNGKLSTSGTFKKGYRVGEWQEFNSKGVLTEITHYDDKGNYDGENKGFDENGKLYYVFQYSKDKLKNYTYYNTDGSVISSGKSGSGNVKVKGYYPDGTLLYEGSYNNGIMDGEWIYYYKSGIKKSVKNFKDGALNGSYISYQKSGDKNIEAEYKDGELSGYYKTFNIDGIVTSEGWYMNDNREGKWITRSEDGTLSNVSYYISGKTNGYVQDYAADGRIQFERLFKNNSTQSLEAFDPQGKSVSKTIFDGKNDYILPNMDGTVRAKGSFTCNEMSKNYIFYYKNGKIDIETQYLNDEKHGEYKSYYLSGKLHRSGKYLNGDYDGEWKTFLENGQLIKKAYYKDGEEDSTWTTYQEDGKLKLVEHYVNGELNDTTKFYNSLGEFMFSYIFEAGDLIGYQYAGANGPISKSINQKDTGTIITYYKNGQISSRQPIKFALIHGNAVFYFSNGTKYLEMTKKYGLNSGPSVEYFANGKVRKVANYLNDNYHGLYQTFREDGTKEYQKEYRNNDNNGTFIYYDKKGNKERTESYWGDIQL